MENIVTVKGVKFLVTDKNEHIQGHWVRGNFYEAQKNGLLSYLLRNDYKDMKCLDIGASIGNHTIYFSEILNCDVISFEPVKSSFNHLERNHNLNDCKNVKLFNVALGSESKQVSMQSMSKTKFNVGMMQVVDGNDVEMKRLDDFLIIGQIDFIKIDVEHYNTPLLKGAENTLKSQVKCDVFIECETEEILKETNKIMVSYGYIRALKVKLNHTPTYLWKK